LMNQTDEPRRHNNSCISQLAGILSRMATFCFPPKQIRNFDCQFL
jgi:hypothetical protein